MLKNDLRATAHALLQWPRLVLLWLVRGYRFWLQPWVGNVCRYEPSCSAYAMQALQQHGATKGLVLAVWRVLRCNPWSLGGTDPVPAQWHWACTHSKDQGCARHTEPNQNGRGVFTRLVQPEAPSTPMDAVPVNRNQP